MTEGGWSNKVRILESSETETGNWIGSVVNYFPNQIAHLPL